MNFNLKFNITINNNPENIWNIMWDSEKYKIWTNSFCKDSYYTTEKFEQGNMIKFLIPSGDGMYSEIETLIPYQKISIRHIGEIKNFENQAPIDTWENAREIYELYFVNNQTNIEVNLTTIEEFIPFFENTFPIALNKLKEICE